MKIEIKDAELKNKLKDWTQDIIEISSDKLNLIDLEVEIKEARNPRDYVDLRGVGGYCPSDELVRITIDSTHRAFGEKPFKQTLVHELHHARRRQLGINTGEDTFLECLVSEGLADSFCMELTGDTPIWAKQINDEEAKNLLKMAKPLFGKKMDDQLYDCWFVSGSYDLPKWSGYSLGYWIISDYLREHNQSSAVSLVGMPASEMSLMV